MPKDIGATSRTSPRGARVCSETSASIASPSERMRKARSRGASPTWVGDKRRDVRCSRAAPRRCSSRAMAWFSDEEGKRGRIEAGHFADLIVPDKDYFSCAEDEISFLTSDLTMVGGKIV